MSPTTLRSASIAQLVTALDGARVIGDAARAVSGLAHDSRSVRPGMAFVALRGERHDGHGFIERAIAGGATALVVDAAFLAANPAPPGVTTIAVADTRRALSRLAAAFYERPSQALRIAGVTGTNGKTTTTHLIQALLAAGDIACGRIGTLGAQFAGAMWPLENTTPLALELQALLAEMRDRGAQAVAMEISSHALALERVADVAVEVAVLTNVTRDHLDFHGDFESYAATKRSLFEMARNSILNADDPHGARWAGELRAQGRSVVTYGLSEGADVRATDLALGPHGSAFSVDGTRFELALPGRFNVANALGALATARAFGIDDATSARALTSVASVAGRMETQSGGGVTAIVDYAHTPDALDVVLRAAREGATGQLTVVFGCGGDRDRGKRPEMGRIARELADRVVITSDNPRSEEPRAIVDEIVAGIADRSNVVVDVERRSAIRRAIVEANAGDVIVVAGKGHETYQIVGDVTGHFDDRDEVRAALAAREAGA
jgi:UDP-N-acetylmuramoyl-L-alanyl-D-glutamate--2,6-diaminopimelate ligase